ncbi:hypothetical protein AVEN_97909-1 [Araneus ventricosus]|uniref:Uncharacterized protein n=1 Tax=Araneus ventricosus TaxID=182803 RepID=A0A4Y2HTQ2_ARAVE|nr:hypothetical protein AVEN_97909-1 [Araneus ventricosus]
MDAQYRLLSFAFTLKSAIDPFRIIRDVERYFKRKSCVVSIKTFCGDLIVCTICGDYAISKVKENDSVLIDKKFYNYKVVEINITSLKIEVPYGIGTDDINRLLRSYGTVMKSEIYSSRGTTGARSDSHIYYGIIELKRDIPSRLKCKYGYINAIELV